ncbi:MAG: LysM peptidoglycan-binding domain-containing protein [Candidatus Latescibacterota bacterium]|nr:LysM peptidoglycan-binding domain-containing protein [Candidatus Latescibacterota bacterium]
MFYFFFYTALVLLSSCSHRHAHDRETSTLQEISPENTKQNQPDPKPVEDLRGIHFLLLRAQEALTLNRAENAQRELDSAFSFLSKLEAQDVDFDTTRANALAFSIERTYLKLLPKLDRFSPNSPLILLLKGLSQEHVEELTGDAPQLVRIHQLIDHCDVPIDANSRVAASIRFFQTRGKKTYATWLSRSGRFRNLINTVLEDQKLPSDLLYISMIESGFNPNAYSKARAVGLWQFIKSTGELEGLVQNHWVDERRDPEKSTRAAANHLKSLYNEFEDWRLAIAAYNSGRGRVRRAIEKAGNRDFWKLSLPEETQNYVPLFMAAVIISKDPQLFGFSDIKFDPELNYETVTLPESWSYVDLRAATKSLNVDEQDLRELNPELRRSITPPNLKKPYQINLPIKMTQIFLDSYPEIASTEKTSVIFYRVQPGDNLSSISKIFGVKPDIITAANTINDPNRIYPGQELFIPTQTSSHKLMPNNNTHTVRYGETLSEISDDHGIRLHELMSWNNLNSSLIKPGQSLKIRSFPENNLTTENKKSQPSIDEQSTFTHTVSGGQTLWEISRSFQVDVDSLRAWNDLVESLIKPGQELILNVKKPKHHAVLKGETFFGIAQKYNLDPRRLVQINNTHLDSILIVGTKLIIPKSSN